MELTAFQMYWLLMLDNISNFFGVVTIVIIFGIALLVLFGPVIVMNVENPPSWNQIKKISIVVGIIISFFGAGVMFIPSTKQMAAIIVVPKIVNNEKVQQLPEELLNFGMEWLEELKPKKETE